MAKIFHPLRALIASATDRELAKYVEYLKAENKILRARIPGQIHTTAGERQKLIKLGKRIGRAMELAHISRFDMETDWQQCGGSWWYNLAYEKGVWCEENGEHGVPTGIYYRPIPKEEADEIADRHLNKYRVIPIDRLIRIAGQEVVKTGESSTGTPYRFTAKIRIYDRRPEEIIGSICVLIFS